MLDLTQIKIKYFEVKMIDGQIINIKKPSHSLMKYVMTFKQQKAKNDEEQFNKLIEFALMMINNNKEGIIYDKEIVKNLDIEVLNLLIGEYMKFIQEVASNPN